MTPPSGKSAYVTIQLFFALTVTAPAYPDGLSLVSIRNRETPACSSWWKTFGFHEPVTFCGETLRDLGYFHPAHHFTCEARHVTGDAVSPSNQVSGIRS